MQDRDALYIGGVWVRPSSPAVVEVENPTTEQRLATVPAGTPADVDRAVAAAAAALPSWSATPVDERAELLRRTRGGRAKRSDEIAETIATEMGCPLRIASKIQAALPQTVVGGYTDLLEAYAFDEQVGNTIVALEAAGVVGAITPWNYPLHQITCKLAPALAAGCTVVLKPTEVAPLVAYLFDVLDEAGVVNLVPGYGTDVGEALAGHPRIDAIFFTGSLCAGTRVAEVAARNVTRVTLELGGKSANVLLPDADVATAVKVGVANAFLNGGQTCTAWTRMVAHEDSYDEAVALAATIAAGYTPGDPLDPATKLGPMVSAAQRDRVRGFIRTGVAEGARVVTGGAEAPVGCERGYFVAPTVLADVEPGSTVAQQEIFGPALSVLRYSDEAQALAIAIAIAIAIDSEYGLAGAVWSADQDRAIAFARRVRTGSIDVNGGRYNPLAPSGGYKRSGVGREMGRAGLEEFLQSNAIQI